MCRKTFMPFYSRRFDDLTIIAIIWVEVIASEDKTACNNRKMRLKFVRPKGESIIVSRKLHQTYEKNAFESNVKPVRRYSRLIRASSKPGEEQLTDVLISEWEKGASKSHN